MIELLLRALIGLAIGGSIVGGTIKVVGLINKSVLVEKIKEFFKKVNPFFAKVTKKCDNSVEVNVYSGNDNGFNIYLRNKAKNPRDPNDFFEAIEDCEVKKVTLKGMIADDIFEGDEILLKN